MSTERGIVGFDIGGQSIKAALVSTDGVMLEHALAPTGHATDIDGLVRTIALLRQQLCGSHDVAGAVGIGIAGALDRAGILRGAPNLPRLAGKPLAGLLAEGLQSRVVIHNDADCAALAEGWGGAADGVDDFLLITLGTGVGSGLILGGSLRQGSSGYGCEFGHMVVVHEGRLCGCGNRGCLEAYVSETAAHAWTLEADDVLRRQVEDCAASSGGGHARAILDLGRSGNAGAEAIASAMVDMLGAAIASAVNVIDLTTIVLGGGIAPGFLARIERLRRAVAASLFARPVDDVALLAAARGPWAGAIGAARAAMLSRHCDVAP